MRKKLTIITILPAVVFLCCGASADTYVSAVERSVFRLVNAERVKNGIAPLKQSRTLTAVARAHSRDMADRGYTSHITPEGKDPSDRAKRAGFNVKKEIKGGYRTGVGENIYEHQAVMEQDGTETPYLEDAVEVSKKAVNGWMNSPGHRKNILNPDYTVCGTGVAVSKDKKVKITQVFF